MLTLILKWWNGRKHISMNRILINFITQSQSRIFQNLFAKTIPMTIISKSMFMVWCRLLVTISKVFNIKMYMLTMLFLSWLLFVDLFLCILWQIKFYLFLIALWKSWSCLLFQNSLIMRDTIPLPCSFSLQLFMLTTIAYKLCVFNLV